ncbi:acetyl/propionyl/methylcrotonyl-CoA carboxylase subunit alpha [Glaciecola petra]|uniref:Acetyl/propionyl/methylcrotonyl-CoA carboxylase subunit alpha n=1 Tax=Glaciecola petra TaxID=3075602 RepID=A0ABU2ZP42_9ALTE|nr:acetyl/propionyl/methylcrotonyl-CoA carboxylase subunit alpha [Aestuariibacter sp. P117]MDT0594186.1 acetyl/propionyl/methylcrotonyl-CoA carboxylase subunit alpha [Aestuariibacter sp. P117]
MIKKLLIANRGEIACRVIRTANKLGIATVAVYSEADVNAQHVKLADEAILLGPAPSSESYLKGDLIIEKALALNVDAIHPGYGFLSENAGFADKCEASNIIFIGPGSEAIRAMGSKSAAKTIMEKAGVPLVPGYHGHNQDPDFLHAEAKKMTYPVLLKAAAGGGGKGMRQVWKDDDFFAALAAAKRESMNSFSDDHMLIEKYLTEPRHVEIQVFCDQHGNGVYLFERDCSVQRRHQKIIEEAPAPGLSEELRKEMGEAALKAAFAIDYRGAGTVEFLLDHDNAFYFMEMNTRLQVEHPVTELITGEDLVEWQIMVANNQQLPKTQEELSCHGHAIEARIYAEDPDNEFLPSTGKIEFLVEPTATNNVRIDTGVIGGDEVSIYYDPMIAKLIVHAPNREQALSLLVASLNKYLLCGVTTNIPYLNKVLTTSAFQNALLTTDFIERHEQQIDNATSKLAPEYQAAICNILSHGNGQTAFTSDHSEDELSFNFRLNHYKTECILFMYGSTKYEIRCQYLEKNKIDLFFADKHHIFFSNMGQNKLTVHAENGRYSFQYYQNATTLWVQGYLGSVRIDKVLPELGTNDGANDVGDILAPMNGTIVSINVAPEQNVEKDQVLAIVEAMKMEHSLKAPFDGQIAECYGAVGERVDGGSVLLSMKKQDKD